MRIMTNKDLDLLDNLPEERKNVFRQRRKKLLNALDIYDKNVLRGRLSETAEEKTAIDTWYNALLDLEEWAFNESSIPNGVKAHLWRT